MFLDQDNLILKDLSAVQVEIAKKYPGSEDAVQEMINYVLRRKSGVSHKDAYRQLLEALKEHKNLSRTAITGRRDPERDQRSSDHGYKER